MEIGLVGLGKMGKNMALRLRRDDHRVVATDRDSGPVQEVEAAGAVAAADLGDLVSKLSPPRTVWVMVPAGDVTGSVVAQLVKLLERGDVIVDGGNSFYRDSIRRAREAADAGVGFLDAGTSGGVWGLEEGYCLMVGGEREHFDRVEPALRTLAPPEGYLHVGPSGAGHFTKMVHNGIEYAVMQAYAEGFELLRASDFDLDLAKLSHLWNQGSVIRSWLLELAGRAFAEDPDLSRLRGYVSDSGEGRWTLAESIDRAVPMPGLALALQARFRSRQEDSFSAKVLAALRNQFGGHAVKKTG
ncbi:MAG: decarboxylating 6-phosphogluconate dehydrogenase [Acidobacteriota bacterium]|jgi:6-phosphogluconate dehydrogenase